MKFVEKEKQLSEVQRTVKKEQNKKMINGKEHYTTEYHPKMIHTLKIHIIIRSTDE